MTNVPERWVQLAYDIVEPQEFDTLDQVVKAVLEPVLADLWRQVEELDRGDFLLLREDVLNLLHTGGLDE